MTPKKSPEAPERAASTKKSQRKKRSRRTQATTAVKGGGRRSQPKAPKEAEAAAPADTGPDTGRVAPEGGDLTLADLADRYIRHLEDIGKSRGTCFGYSMDMQVAVKHFGAGAKAAKLTPAKVKSYFEADAVVKNRAGKARAKPTIDKLRRVFRQSLVWAASEGLIPSAPVPEAYIPSGKRKKQAAS